MMELVVERQDSVITSTRPGPSGDRAPSRASLESDWSGSIERLCATAPYLMATGRGAELLHWTATFPASSATLQPWVIHYHGVGLRLTNGDLIAASRLQERALAIFVRIEDRRGQTCALAELGVLAWLRDRPEDAQRYLNLAHTTLAPLDPGNRSSLLNLIATLNELPQLTRETNGQVTNRLLGNDEMIRSWLMAAIRAGRLTARGLRILREQYRLTPAETNVFIQYYLGEDAATANSQEPKRRRLARQLHVSENTLMHHISSVRRKLGFVARNGSAAVLVWSLAEGITSAVAQPGWDHPAGLQAAALVDSETARSLRCHPGWRLISSSS